MIKKITTTTLNIIKTFLISLGSITIILALLSFNVKGDVDNPLHYQTELDTKLSGPYESSGSTSRYALTKSIVDNGSLLFDTELAKFASPDVVGINGKYTTLFTPGVSLAATPFYYVGKLLGLPQLLTYLSTTLFAALNIFLIYLVSRKFNISRALAIISGLIFGFSTSALAYSNTLTQHHFSVTLILLAILNASMKRSFLNNLTFGLIAGASALVDIPNLFMMLPIGLYIFAKNFSLNSDGEKLKLTVKTSVIALLLGVIPMFGLFGWYNYQTTGSYTKLAQSIGRTDIFATDEIKEINKQAYSRQEDIAPPILPFETRMQLNGFYILLISDERGIIYYNPILIFGILGLILAVKNRINENIGILIISVALVNILLYSMFGDPWGGWSFGPRYLIPSIALFSTGIGFFLSRTLRNPFIIILFVGALIYSTVVNSLGSATTNLVPPKVEALNLAVTVPHTYLYNIQLAEQGKSGVLIYNLFLKNIINVKEYIYAYSALIIFLILSLYFTAIILTKKARDSEPRKSRFSLPNLNFKWRTR
jgi:hypothetical protein